MCLWCCDVSICQCVYIVVLFVNMCLYYCHVVSRFKCWLLYVYVVVLFVCVIVLFRGVLCLFMVANAQCCDVCVC